MALAKLASMAHDDDQLYDLSKGMGKDYDPPEYPMGLQFCLPKDLLEQVGGEDGEPDDTMRFSAMAEVTSVFRGREDCRVELEIKQFAGEDGKFVDVNCDEPWSAPSICLCGPELEKMELKADCEMGDTVHLIGTARIESMSSNQFSGDRVTLQITELTCEDESEESREG